MRAPSRPRLDSGRWATIAYTAIAAIGLVLVVLSGPAAIRTLSGGNGSSDSARANCPGQRQPTAGLVCSLSPAGGPNAASGTAARGSGGFRSVVGHPGAVNFQPDRTRISSCGNVALCYEQAFGNLTYYRGPKVALPLLDRMSGKNQAVRADCHRIGHSMGSAALLRYRGNVARAFAEGMASCWSGYYHGILERAFKKVVTKPDMIRKSRNVCFDRRIRRTVWLAYQCVHGLGHGLMIHTGYALPFALDVCGELPTDWDRRSCTGGVFMENINASFGAGSLWLRDDDGVYPCQAVRESAKAYCYLMATSRILQVNGGSWENTVQTCERVEPKWVDTCFQSLGRDASGRTRASTAGVMSICRLAERYMSSCVFGAARDFTAQFAGGARAARLCETAPVEMQAQCFYQAGTIMGSMSRTPAQRRAACERITRRYAGWCEDGAATAPDLANPA